MSAILSYKIPQKNQDLGDRLKRILTEKYRLNDGSKTIDSSELDYLQGLADAGVEDADTLGGLIVLHGKIEIYLEY